MQYSPHNYVIIILFYHTYYKDTFHYILKTHFFGKTLHPVKKIFCQAMIYNCRRMSDSDFTSRLPPKIEEITKTIVIPKDNRARFERRTRGP